MGRERECGELDRLLADVRGGGSRVLVLRGAAGIGKSALLAHLVAGAAGCRVVTAAAVRPEAELPFAAVHQLCAPLLDLVGALPEPQRDALGTAFGMRAGPAPEPSLVGLAVLALLGSAAAEHPLVCVIDDAQWVDRPSSEVLAFVARGLTRERVACVFAVRDSPGTGVPPGLPVLDVGGLRDDAARALVGRTVPGPLDEEVRDRILAEARGNPSALLELAGAASAGGFAVADGRQVPHDVADELRHRLSRLPGDGRTAVLLAAADPLGDPALLVRAATALGLGSAAVAAAGELVAVGARVRFRDPRLRAAVYGAAAPRERRRVHRALAEATDGDTCPDRRAWHRAHGVAHPDEDVAAELERSAGRAQARGGLAAAAAFLELAAGCTPDPRRRAARALDAARARHLAGAPEAAAALLAAAEAEPPDEPRRTRIEYLRTEIALAAGRDVPAPVSLLAAARRLGSLDAGLSRDVHRQALFAAIGALPGWGGIGDVAAAVRAAAPEPGAPRVADLVLDALSRLYAGDAAAAGTALRRAVAAALEEEAVPAERLGWLWPAGLCAMALWDDAACRELTARHLRLIRGSGALVLLPAMLRGATLLRLFEGDLAGAAALNAEAKAAPGADDVRSTSAASPPWSSAREGALALAAWRGDEAETERLAQAVTERGAARGRGRTAEAAHWLRSVLHNGLGRYETALEAVRRAGLDDRAPGGCGVQWAPPELIEAAARTGHRELAVRTLERFSRSTRAGGADWGLGVEARCRALLHEGEDADRLYREAIDRLGRTRMRADLARAHLLYGEWLRRERRRVQARDRLRTARDLFGGMGMAAFADRAARELAATGETARRRTAGSAERLTPQEARIAGLARDGLTNKEIAARLYVSHRTVEYHLGRVFTKLGVTSRHELGGRL